MMDDLTIVFFGIIGGFSSSAPLGVINLWITDAVLDKNEEKIKWFILGVILADMAHAALASWGYHSFLQDAGVDHWIALFGGAFVIVMGVLGLWRKKDKAPHEKKKRSGLKRAHEFILGLVMCGANPGFFVFWMFIINIMENRVGIVIESRNLGLFLMGISLGDGMWFAGIITLARRGRDFVQPKTIRVMRTLIAFAFIGVGATAIIKTF